MPESKLLEFIGEIISSSSDLYMAVLSLKELENILDEQHADRSLIKLVEEAVSGLNTEYDTMKICARNASRFTREWLEQAVRTARENAQSRYGRC